MLLHETIVGPRRSRFCLANNSESSKVDTKSKKNVFGLFNFTIRFYRISLNTMTLQVESPTVYTSQGVPISVTGIAQVKIQGQNEDMLLVSFWHSNCIFMW